MHEQTDRDDLLIWSIRENFSSLGNELVVLKTFIAKENAFI
jgi:hypothetical protein